MADRKRPINRLRVLRTEWLTPHMIRVVLGGDGLASFQDNGYTDRYVKLLFLKPGVDYAEPIDLDAIHKEMPREDWPIPRTYTVRYYDEAAGELAVDFVTHGDTGFAAPWAMTAEPGDEIDVRGPGGAYAPSPDVDWHLLVGDETGMPAIGAALEALPADARGRVFLQVADPDEVQKLTVPAGVEVSWLFRADFESDEAAGDALVEAVRSYAFPEGSVHAFVHGEAGFVQGLRRHLRTDRAVPRDMLSISGYWRRGKTEEGWRAEKAEMRKQEEAQAAASA
jgi:NADPH-dependent ferric siderophore reductase